MTSVPLIVAAPSIVSIADPIGTFFASMITEMLTDVMFMEPRMRIGELTFITNVPPPAALPVTKFPTTSQMPCTHDAFTTGGNPRHRDGCVGAGVVLCVLCVLWDCELEATGIVVVTPGTVVATGGDDESEIEGVVVGGSVGAAETGVKSGRGKKSKELIYMPTGS